MWLNGGVAPTQVAEWAGHSLNVLLRIYAKCLVGQDEIARRLISEALREADDGNQSGAGKRPSGAADDPPADESGQQDSRDR
jgi:hypothetical protein